MEDNSLDNYPEVLRAWNDFSLPGSGRPFKLTRKMLDVIEEQMRQGDETTATQLVRILEERGYKVSKTAIVRARRILGWTFHGSHYCQLKQSMNKERI